MFSIKRVYITRVFLPVLWGGIIYCSLRDPNIAIFRLIDNSALYGFIIFLHRISMPVARLFPPWFSYSLPDALWCYACISLSLIYWRKGPVLFKAFWLSAAIIFSLGFEAGQLLNIVPGTFCAYDLLFSISAVVLALSTDMFYGVPIKLGPRNTLTSSSFGPPISC